MGTWGSGNFEDDTAADHLADLTGRLVDEIVTAMAGDPVELEPDECWGVAVPVNLELLHLIAQQRYVGARLPAFDVLEGWKSQFLAVWDESIDGLAPAPGHKASRRGVLERTFDQLAEVARSRE